MADDENQEDRRSQEAPHDRLVAHLALAASLLLAQPASAKHSGEGCDNDAGAALLGEEGVALTFAAPTATAPELAATSQAVVTAAGSRSGTTACSSRPASCCRMP